MQVLKNGKIRRSEEEWSKLVALFEQSGQSRVRFCKEQGIAGSSFSKWHQRFKGGQFPAVVKPQFVEVPKPRKGGGEAEVELVFVSGLKLCIRG